MPPYMGVATKSLTLRRSSTVKEAGLEGLEAAAAAADGWDIW